MFDVHISKQVSAYFRHLSCEKAPPMHLSSIENMKHFRSRYLAGKEDSVLKIVDLGSMDIGGCYRPIFTEAKWDYVGIDLAPGENVDIVLSDPYNWLEIDSSSVDVVISGQAFEHIAFFWKTMAEITRILTPGGLCCIIAPSGGPEHKYPVDCWRFFPDGFRALAHYAGLEVLSATTQQEPQGFSDDSDTWADTVLVARKANRTSCEDTAGEHIYRRKIHTGSEDSLSKIVRHIQTKGRVLELGPATGYLTKYLKENIGCVVHAIEKSEEMAHEARKFCEKMIVADIDSIQLETQFSENTYDYIIIGDVLEHLRESEKTLISCRNLLTPDGKCIISVPNIGHASIIGGLIKGHFNYTHEGLLDRTHVHFYTRESLANLLQKCGFSIRAIDTVTRLPEETEIGDSLADLPFSLQKHILSIPDALTYQFIVVCGRTPTPRYGSVESGRARPSAIDLRRLHLQELGARITELEEAFSGAQQLAFERLEALHEKDKTINVYEKSVQEYADALSHAQQLAFTRLDAIEQLRSQMEMLQAQIEMLQAQIEMLQNNPGYKIYEKARSLLTR